MGKHAYIVTDVTHFRKAGSSMCLTVPKGVRSALNWADGQAILIRVQDNRVELESLVEHMKRAAKENEAEFEPRS